ncbi:MAG: ornithine carbamoyltransferase, partial [Bacilli bacterium]|nr:ornithine carbamoyltransferase [Bacilli bacterium]
MNINLKDRSFLTLLDYQPEEISYLLELSHKLKQIKRSGNPHPQLPGKNIVLLFEKDSTRTRCAFEVGAYDLGMQVTYLGPSGSQMGNKE